MAIKTLPITTQEIFDIADRYCDSALLQFAHASGLFELLQEPMSVTAVAEVKRWVLRKTRILLNALTTLGLLLKQNDQYQNAPATSEALVKASPAYIGDLIEHERLQWQLWSRIGDVLASEKVVEGQQDLNLPQNKTANLVFHRAMQQLSKGLIEHILKLLTWTRPQHVLDLAGGHGLYLAELAKQNPAITGEIWDVSSARSSAEDVISQYGVQDRVQFRECDITLATSYKGVRADAILLNHCLHHFEHEVVRLILSQARNVLPPNGLLAVTDVTLHTDRIKPSNGALFSLYMMVNTIHGEVHPTAWIAEEIQLLGFDVEVSYINNLEDDALIIGYKK